MRKKPVSLQAKQQRVGYFFVLPLLLGIFLIFIPNIITTAQFSFNDVKINGSEGYSLVWQGWKYYNEALRKDATFIPSIVSSYKKMLINIPIILIFSMLMASVLNQKFHGRGIARAIFFIPVLLSTGIMIELDRGFLSGSVISSGVSTGSSLDNVLKFDMSAMLASLNFNKSLIGIVESAVSNIHSILESSGMQIYIFLAGIQEIPEYLYEAAAIEGCSKWESFWKITFPMLSPQIAVNLIYTIVIVGQDSEALYNATSQATSLGRYGLSTAMCMIYLATLAVTIALLFLVLNKIGIVSSSESAGVKK